MKIKNFTYPLNNVYSNERSSQNNTLKWIQQHICGKENYISNLLCH